MLSTMKVALCACVVASGRLFSTFEQNQQTALQHALGSNGGGCAKQGVYKSDSQYTCCATDGSKSVCVQKASVNSKERLDCARFRTANTEVGQWKKWDEVNNSPCDEGSVMFNERVRGGEGRRFVRATRAKGILDGGKVRAKFFYRNDAFHGHWPEHLHIVHEGLRAGGCQEFVWLAGDSTLDNKYWVLDDAQRPALNGYEGVLQPPSMYPDVNYWLNQQLQLHKEHRAEGKPSLCAINTAREASTVGERTGSGGRLNAQDKFLRDHVSGDDVVVVSVGGNDIALNPTFKTVVSMATLLCFSSTEGIRKGCPVGSGHFIKLFKDRMTEYIENLLAKRKPKKVIVCMLYFLDEKPCGGGWCDRALKLLNYDKNPAKLQAMIMRMFELATSKIQLAGTQTVPLPLYLTLDGKTSSDYAHRVEPSMTGGEKMARALLEPILQP